MDLVLVDGTPDASVLNAITKNFYEYAKKNEAVLLEVKTGGGKLSPNQGAIFRKLEDEGLGDYALLASFPARELPVDAIIKAMAEQRSVAATIT